MVDKEYIEREAFRREIDEHRPGRSYEDAWALTILDSIPAADVRPAVLCRDCKNADYSCMGSGCVWCNEMERAMRETDFCSRGAKMEDGDVRERET